MPSILNHNVLESEKKAQTFSNGSYVYSTRICMYALPYAHLMPPGISPADGTIDWWKK